jgi:PAS domain S-box-containing protein
VVLEPDLVRSVLDSAPDAMIIVEASGTILFANHQLEALFGHIPEEIIGRNVDDLLPERFKTRHVAHRRTFLNEGRVRPMGAGLDLYARRRDGTEFPVEISLSPIRDGERTLVVAAIRDVTERKRIQAELMEARRLADEAREAADRANEGKSRFLATASHDLRQPLQTLALLNGALRRMLGDTTTAEVLAQQDQAISAMSRLLNALLDISKLESGAIKPELCDFEVAVLFEGLRAEFAGLAVNKGLTLKVEPCEDFVRSDPSLVERILRNLLANAIKYTREGVVRLRCLHEAGVVRIQVSDTGIGISNEHLPHIFDEFYQVGVATNTVREGYGLGLSIVQRLARLLNIAIDVESEAGKGSVFSLELPASAMQSATANPGGVARAGAVLKEQQRPRVLVVEDDPAVMSATLMLLRLEGYVVTSATSVAEAVEKSREHPDIRVLITDFHLKDGEKGTDVIAAVREALRPDVRAILVTGDTSTAIKGLRLDERLRITSKPINADELLRQVSELLGA